MTVPISPAETSGATFAAELRLWDIGRKPGDPAGKAEGIPPLWVEPAGGVPAPGTKQDVEDDPLTVLGLIFDDEVASRPFSGTRTFVWKLRIRCKGDRPARRAQHIDKRIWDIVKDWRGRTMAIGQDEQQMVHSVDVWTGLQFVAATKADGHTYDVAWAITVYA